MQSNTHLREALIELAPTHQERATKLGVTPRMVMFYLDGKHMPSLRVLSRSPELIEALLLDLTELRAKQVIETAA